MIPCLEYSASGLERACVFPAKAFGDTDIVGGATLDSWIIAVDRERDLAGRVSQPTCHIRSSEERICKFLFGQCNTLRLEIIVVLKVV